MKEFNKVFGIGLGKTGTFSLTDALELLGIPTLHHAKRVRRVLQEEREEDKKILSTFSEYRGFTDHPFNRIYKEADEEYPNSKFILTLRDLDDWVLSKYKWWTHKPESYKKENGPFDVQEQKDWHRRHIANALEYFSGRDEDFITLRICEGEGWNKLCPFLGVNVPDCNFPHSNKSSPDKEYEGISEVKKCIS